MCISLSNSQLGIYKFALILRLLFYSIDKRLHQSVTRGGVEKLWNGGGDDTVHSSVSAPCPQ